MDRTDEQLRELSVHVLWHVRQFCRLGGHLGRRRQRVGPSMIDALDAAALEAFLVHTRALADFVWRTRTGPYGQGERPPWKDDGLAEDYFGTGEWRPVPLPDDLPPILRRIGWGVVHVSYRRLNAEEAWGWDFERIGVLLYFGLIEFARCVPAERVVDAFSEAVRSEFVEKFHLDSRSAILRAGVLGHSVGTPILHWWLPNQS